jgi:hypothetical protein
VLGSFFSLLLVGVTAISIGLGATAAPARSLSAREGSSSRGLDVDRLLAQVGDPTPTPTLTTDTTPTPTPTDETEDTVGGANDPGQDTTDQVESTVEKAREGVENAVDGVQGEGNQTSAQAADQVDNTTAAVQGESDLHGGAWTEASNPNSSADADLGIVVAAGNDLVREPPAGASAGDPARGDPPNPWWLPVTGSQWLLLGSVVALFLIALGSVLVAVRRRRGHQTAGWAR